MPYAVLTISVPSLDIPTFDDVASGTLCTVDTLALIDSLTAEYEEVCR